MYSYIKQFPKDREMGWSNETNGVCHDANNWFFTQDGNLWKFPLTHRIGDTCKSANVSKGIYKVSTGKHLGDIDHYNGYIFVPVSDNGSIRIYKASNLAFVSEQIIKRQDGRSFSSIGWLAINPNSGLLYTSDKCVGQANSGSTSLIHIYKIGDVTKPNPLTLHSTARLFDEYAEVLNREHMQGGCFDNDDHLHIVNGYVTHNKGTSASWANSKGGISVFKVSRTPSAGGSENLYRLTHSNQSSGFRFQFNGTGEEPEGVTYWDLDSDKRGPEMEGQLHAIMIDNCGSGDDDFFFKHYRKSRTGFYRVSVKTGDIDSAGTDADIFITLKGTNGTSNEVELDSPRDDFERGNTDRFIIETTRNVGTLKQIVVRSDNSGKYAEFFLERVTVMDIDTNRTYNFPCNKWLNKNQKVCIIDVK